MADRITEIFEKYDFTVNGTSRGRGVTVLNTDKGLKMIKEYRGSGRHIEWSALMLDNINASNNLLVDSYEKNKDNEYISTGNDGTKYIVKSWYECRDCDVKSFGDIVQTAGTLAILHNELERYGPESPDYKSPNPLNEMEKHNKELWRIRKYLSGKNNKNNFELMAAAYCDSFCEEGQRAAEAGRNNKPYFDNMSLSHGEYNYHNICFTKTLPVVVNFEKLSYGWQIMDLYNYIRKIMEKYDWDIRLGYKLITEYDRKRRITDDDMKVLCVFFRYPEKFWKILNGYYNSNKAWIPFKNEEKLRRVIEQNGRRLEFINTVQ